MQVYHVLPFPDGKNYDGIFSYNTLLGKGSLLLFKPGTDTPSNKTVLLRGLRRESRYQLQFQDRTSLSAVVSGAHAMDLGVAVTNMDGPEASEIVWVTKV